MQLLDDPRGFSFQYEAALDMRFNPKQAVTAADIVNSYSEVDLAQLIRKYGEEPMPLKSPGISSRRDRLRPPRSGGCCRNCRWRPTEQNSSGHTDVPALRIAVNEELEHLEETLDKASICSASADDW